MVQARADAQVRFAVHEGLHLAAFLPGADAPPGVVRVGERVRAEVAFGLHGLLDGGDGIGEELIKERGVPEPKPGHDDNGHDDLLLMCT
jgi:hypothetical protein